MLKQTNAAIKAANPQATVIWGPIFGHDIGGATVTVREGGTLRRVTKRGELVIRSRSGGPQATGVPCPNTVPSGTDYLCETYEMGKSKAGWGSSAPGDHLAQNLYIDQGGSTSESKLRTYVQEFRTAYEQYEGRTTSKKTHITEIGWTTEYVSPAFQARNLETTYRTFRNISYVARTYWFFVQDIPEAGLYYGLVNTSGREKRAFGAYQRSAVY